MFNTNIHLCHQAMAIHVTAQNSGIKRPRKSGKLLNYMNPPTKIADYCLLIKMQLLCIKIALLYSQQLAELSAIHKSWRWVITISIPNRTQVVRKELRVNSSREETWCQNCYFVFWVAVWFLLFLAEKSNANSWS